MNKEMLKSAMTHGAIIGAILISYSVILYIAGYNQFNPSKQFNILGMIPNLLMIAGIVWAQINFRDKVLNGNITYGKSLGYGTFLGVFFGILQTFYLIIFMLFIDTDVLQYIYDVSEQAMIEQGLSTADIDTAMAATKKMTLPMMMIGGVIGTTFTSFVVSLVSSAFVKKVTDPFKNDMKNIE